MSFTITPWAKMVGHVPVETLQMATGLVASRFPGDWRELPGFCAS